MSVLRRTKQVLTIAAISTAGVSCDVLGYEDNTTPKLPQITSKLSVGEATTCALNSAQLMYCWGLNSSFLEHGVLAPSEPGPTTPVSTNVAAFVALMPGHGSHFCGLMSDGSGHCWGRNSHGQLGGGSVFATGRTFGGVMSLEPWSSISISRLSSCGVTTSRRVLCWGSNQRGEGGTVGRTLGSSTGSPRQIDGLEQFQSIATGWLHTCALTTTGVAMCWGDNQSGQLGLGSTDTTVHRSPAAVTTTLRFQQLTAGSNYTCGVTQDNAAYCWGQNSTGQLGDGTTINRATPTAVSSSLRFASVHSSTGFGTGSSVTIPVAPQGGVAHTCALTTTGDAYCWGWNGAGQLGDGTTASRLTPVAVLGGRTFAELGLGGSHTCGKRNETVFCWGGNQSGQLGDGTKLDSSIPVSAGAPFKAN